ncbi:hypothetical protein P9112_001919 [Eukaryota sp. TZLM1-RC]
MVLVQNDIENLVEQPPMFCYQCEQAGSGPNAEKGCFTSRGVCSKDHELSALFDNVIAAAFHLAIHARPIVDQDEKIPKEWTHALTTGFFLTLTNVDFDHERVPEYIHNLYKCAQEAKQMLQSRNLQPFQYPGEFGEKDSFQLRDYSPATTLDELKEQGRHFGVYRRLKNQGVTVTGLQEVSLYGIKGIGAYSHHTEMLGGDVTNDGVGIVRILTDILKGEKHPLEIAKETGKLNLDTMTRLDSANVEAYGTPSFTRVNYGVRQGKAILMSGHDLRDLASLLKATEGTGINVYTHGEMLMANSYPKLREYSHLVGNFGSAWQNQRKEFSLFPGPIVVNTNCIMPARENYKDRLFTCNLVGLPGVTNIDYVEGNYPEKDWTPVIEMAKQLPGFESDGPPVFENFLNDQVTGANWRTTTPLVPAVIDLVKTGKLRRIVFVGGCDGSYPGRNYFTNVAQNIKDKHPDVAIAGSACGVYRYVTTMDFGNIPGTEVPRFFHLGQCNDTFSGIQLVAAVAKELGAGLNDVPISYFVSWFEQKAVGILLTLVYLGIKNIRLGPRLPAFFSPEALSVLKSELNLMHISDDAEKDLEAALRGE